MCVESLTSFQVYSKLLFCANGVTHSSNMIYCRACKNCSDCFACVGLQHKQYCLFNTQYSKGVYEQLVEKVLSHMMGTKEWGEFFDPSVSLFGYNETVAQEYFPLTSEEALKK